MQVKPYSTLGHFLNLNDYELFHSIYHSCVISFILLLLLIISFNHYFYIITFNPSHATGVFLNALKTFRKPDVFCCFKMV